MLLGWTWVWPMSGVALAGAGIRRIVGTRQQVGLGSSEEAGMGAQYAAKSVRVVTYWSLKNRRT